MKIFVTGCAGLLGANYTRHLLKNGHHVVGIDDLSGGYKAFVPTGENFTFAKFNLEKRKKVVELFEEHKPEVLLHFAAYAERDYLHLFVILTIAIILFALLI